MCTDFVCHLLETRPPLKRLVHLNVLQPTCNCCHSSVTVRALTPPRERVAIKLHRSRTRNTVAHLRETKQLLKHQIYWPYPLKEDKPNLNVAPALHATCRKLKMLLLGAMLHKSLCAYSELRLAAHSSKVLQAVSAEIVNTQLVQTVSKEEQKCKSRATTSNPRATTASEALALLNLTSDCGLAHRDFGRPTPTFSRAARFKPTTPSRRRRLKQKRSMITKKTHNDSILHHSVSCSTFARRQSKSTSRAMDIGFGGRAPRFGRIGDSCTLSTKVKSRGSFGHVGTRRGSAVCAMP